MIGHANAYKILARSWDSLSAPISKELSSIQGSADPRVPGSKNKKKKLRSPACSSCCGMAAWSRAIASHARGPEFDSASGLHPPSPEMHGMELQLLAVNSDKPTGEFVPHRKPRYRAVLFP